MFGGKTCVSAARYLNWWKPVRECTPEPLWVRRRDGVFDTRVGVFDTRVLDTLGGQTYHRGFSTFAGVRVRVASFVTGETQSWLSQNASTRTIAPVSVGRTTRSNPGN